MSPYELSSGWKEKHRILTEMEDRNPDVLRATVERSLFAFKLRNIEMLIDSKQKEMDKLFKAKEVYQHLLQEIAKLNKAKSHFSEKLTRIILH